MQQICLLCGSSFVRFWSRSIQNVIENFICIQIFRATFFSSSFFLLLSLSMDKNKCALSRTRVFYCLFWLFFFSLLLFVNSIEPNLALNFRTFRCKNCVFGPMCIVFSALFSFVLNEKQCQLPQREQSQNKYQISPKHIIKTSI